MSYMARKEAEHRALVEAAHGPVDPSDTDEAEPAFDGGAAREIAPSSTDDPAELHNNTLVDLLQRHRGL